MPPKQHVSKQTYTIAKEYAANDAINKTDAAELEDEVMGVQSDVSSNLESFTEISWINLILNDI